MDERPSGLNSEPSTYSAWAAFVWPLVLYYVVHARKVSGNMFAAIIFAGLCASAFLCNARTIAAIIVLQLGYLGYWIVRTKKGLYRLGVFAVYLSFAVFILALFAERFSSLADSDAGSNIGRIGSTVTAIRVSLAHPAFGVGIGQLKYFFAAYAPDFALVSDEILSYAAGLSQYRASSFNMFVRLICEFGFALGVIFSILLLRPIFSAIRLRSTDNFIPYAVLAAIGGVGFWLSQDQYGYQPAILSLAILSNALAGSAGPQNRRDKNSNALSTL
jgi:hypothetical protein